jgi:Mg/Co/Ni transporter MgtE
VDGKTQRSLVEELDDQEAAALLQAVPSDEGTDFLEQLPKAAAERLLGLMETRHSRKLSQLLGYSSDSAGGIMIAEYTAFARRTPVREALERIKERAMVADPGPFVAILDEQNRLVGATVIRRLLVADPAAPIMTAALPRFHHVHPSSSLREVAYLMEKYRAFTIPVVDENMVLLGIITMDDVLERIIPIAWRRARRRGNAVL